MSQGFSIVPLNEHGGGAKGMFTKKKIHFKRSRINLVCQVYVAAVVSKMAAVVDQCNSKYLIQ